MSALALPNTVKVIGWIAPPLRKHGELAISEYLHDVTKSFANITGSYYTLNGDCYSHRFNTPEDDIDRWHVDGNGEMPAVIATNGINYCTQVYVPRVSSRNLDVSQVYADQVLSRKISADNTIICLPWFIYYLPRRTVHRRVLSCNQQPNGQRFFWRRLLDLGYREL